MINKKLRREIAELSKKYNLPPGIPIKILETEGDFDSRFKEIERIVERSENDNK